MSLDYYRTRRTIEEEIEIEGIGIHTNSETTLKLKPAGTGENIKFIRTDLEENKVFWPRVENVKDIPRATVITNGEHDLYTIEHLMASLYGLGITDVVAEVDGPELPALNGSAGGYVQALRETGFKKLEGEREVYRVKEPLYVEDADQSIVLLPSTGLKISCTISFENDFIGDQYLSTEIDADTFAEKIAPARTFGFKEEIEDLLDNNLARGGSLDNAIVLNEDGDLVGDEPQFPDEFVRHKILDIIGDISLVGSFIAGHVVAIKNSHFLNVALAEKLDRRISYSPQAIEQKSNQGGDEMLNIDEIKEIIPHRYPFLLIDRILSMDHENQKAVGLKNVTSNEEFFNGHFPGDPIMPGVLIIEAIAQLGAAWILSKAQNKGKNIYFMGVDNIKWRRPVRPGDQLIFEVEGKRLRKKSGMMEGQALVNGEVAAEGLFKFALVNP
ncbi:MAG: UDP-3-O-acyl-N-acetylglucosamine deacetylase [bacterium]